MMIVAISVSVFDYEPLSTSNSGQHVQQSFPFLLVLVSHMDHGTISNHQIIWWGLLMFASPQ